MLRLALKHGIKVSILPRVGVSANVNCDKPEKIIAYQMMGRDKDGDTCPFLDVSGAVLSPHGGHGCRIYEKRPLACMAYPLQGHRPAEQSASLPDMSQDAIPMLDSKCRFCREHDDDDDTGNWQKDIGCLHSEEDALLQIERATFLQRACGVEGLPLPWGTRLIENIFLSGDGCVSTIMMMMMRRFTYLFLTLQNYGFMTARPINLAVL